jgi:hypothetical protein
VQREYELDNYTERAVELFDRFARRHGFRYEADTRAPVEVMWTLPAQAGLSLPIILGLQNEDELNFGVGDFWSYFFPFNDVVQRFEKYLDMWVSGDARIAITGRKGRVMQVRDGTRWKSVYGAGRLPFVWRRPKGFIQNDPTYSNSTMT